MALTYSQIMGLWIQAGGNAAAAPIAAAVAMAESGGNPQAHNPRPPDDSYGLWQINMYGSLGPARRRQFGLSSNTQLYDPLTNAKAAVAIASGGSNWKPWTTFTSGAYKKYLNSSVTPDMNAGGALGGIGSGLGGLGGSAGGDPVAQQAAVYDSVVTGFFTRLYPVFNTTGNYVVFAGAAGVGIIVLMAGFVMLFKGSDPTGVVGAVRAVGTVTGVRRR